MNMTAPLSGMASLRADAARCNVRLARVAGAPPLRKDIIPPALILSAMVGKPASVRGISAETGFSAHQIYYRLPVLIADGLVQFDGRHYAITDAGRALLAKEEGND